MVHFSDILMVLKDSRFKSCERIYTIHFFPFSQNQIFRHACLTVPNCKLLENILDTFCIAQIWYDLSILRMFTFLKCKGHTNFEVSEQCQVYHLSTS